MDGGDGAQHNLNKGDPLDGGEHLWRRIPPIHFKDGRLTSAAFSGIEMSVDVASIQQDMSITLGDDAGVAEFKAAAAQALDQRTVADPLPDNPAHALVVGHKSKSVRRRLREASRFKSREQILRTAERDG